jgi:hypothetical protein
MPNEYRDEGAEQWIEYNHRSTERSIVYSIQLDRGSVNHFCRFAALRDLACRLRLTRLGRLNIFIFISTWYNTCRSYRAWFYLNNKPIGPTTPWAFCSSCLVQQYRFRDLVRHVQVTVIKRLGIHLHLPTELRELVESQNNVELGTSDLIEIEVWPACLRYAAP